LFALIGVANLVVAGLIARTMPKRPDTVAGLA